MKSVLVLGLGNRLMMDDGVGVAVVEALAGQGLGNGRVTCAVGETDFEYGLNLAMDYDRVIVVDAAMTGRQPGEVSVIPLGRVSAGWPGLSVHDLHFLDLLARHEQEGVLIAIEPAEIDVHCGLSRALSDNLGNIVTAVAAAIAELTLDLP